MARGALFGLTVWAGSYLGLVPALQLLAPATRHPWRRNVLMDLVEIVADGRSADVFDAVGRLVESGQDLKLVVRDLTALVRDLMIVSVDPDGDTPEKAQAFLEKHRIAGPDRHYLLGDAATLAPVWLAYGVGTAPLSSGQRQAEGAAQFGRVGHTDASFLIDREGKKRTLLRGDATADDIARGLRILLR